MGTLKEGLRLKESLEKLWEYLSNTDAELRRLHYVHKVLLNALKETEDYLRHSANSPDMADKVKAAIAKATGE